MGPDIENILRRQAQVLPDEVREFIARADWGQAVDTVSERFQLSPENAGTLFTETMLTLAGLVHPNEFKEALKRELAGVDPVVVDTITAEIGVTVFAPVRSALEEFFAMQEEAEGAVESEVVTEVRPLEKMPDVAPDNLPTGEIQSLALESDVLKPGFGFLPPLIPKTHPSDDASAEEGTHPFEEKMKKVFTSGGADISNLELPPISATPPPSRPTASDPYREAIE